MKIAGLGHVALRVTDMDASKHFYHELLGLPYSGEHADESMVFFRADEHHNLALFLTNTIENTHPPLDHVAFQLQGDEKELAAAQAELESKGISVNPYSHREVESLYIRDPDANQIELYVKRTD